MSSMRAVPLDWLVRANQASGVAQPRCPGCKLGRLHPYRVEIGLSAEPGGWDGVDFLEGWVAVCVGNGDALAADRELYERLGDPPPCVQEQAPCGFSMPMVARQHEKPSERPRRLRMV